MNSTTIRLHTNLGLPEVEVDLNAKAAFVGRATGDLILDRPEVSGRHLSIELVDGQVVMSDLDSFNGTCFAGSREAVTQRTPVQPRTPVCVGDQKFELWYEIAQKRSFACPQCGVPMEVVLFDKPTSTECSACHEVIKLPVVGIVVPSVQPPPSPAVYTLDCPSCSKQIAAMRDEVGKQVRCPLCQDAIHLPAPQSS